MADFNDFGFSTVSEDEYKAQQTKTKFGKQYNRQKQKPQKQTQKTKH